MTTQKIQDADVIVIGAGIAGLVAAREAESAGLSTLVLEASERAGGRVVARPYAGTDKELEFGGNAYSPEFQPSISAEYKRYSLAEVGTPETGDFVQFLNGTRTSSSLPVPEDEIADLERALAHWLKGVERISFDKGFDQQDLADLDVSVADYFAPLNLPQATLEHLYSWSVHCNGEDPERVSALHMMRWFAAFGNSVWNYYAKAERKWPTSAEYVSKLLADVSGKVLFETPALSVETEQDGVVVSTPEGSYSAGAVIVASPINAWKTIAFTPALEGGKALAAEQGQLGPNSKIFIRVKGGATPIFGTAYAAGVGVVYLNSNLSDGTQILVAFINARRVDTSDLAAVQSALRTILPEIEVLSVDEENWQATDYRGGGLTTFGPGQLSRFDSSLRDPHGRVFFAGSDISQRWGGWVEGAVETASEAAGAAAGLLKV